MEKFSVVLEDMKRTISSKRIGFYLALISSLLALVSGIIYKIKYDGSDYYSAWAFSLPIVGLCVFIVLSLFSKTSKFASIITTVLSFVSFLIFINASYMYLSEVFYGGFNMKAIQEMDKGYIVILFMFLISGIIGNVSIYQKQNKLQEDNKHE